MWWGWGRVVVKHPGCQPRGHRLQLSELIHESSGLTIAPSGEDPNPTLLHWGRLPIITTLWVALNKEV